MKKIFWGGFLLVCFFSVWKYILSSDHDTRKEFPNIPFNVSVIVNNEEFIFSGATEKTIGDFLAARNFRISENDRIFPEKEKTLLPGTRIFFVPARKVTVMADGTQKNFVVTGRTVAEILDENQVVLDEDDIVKPARENMVSDNTKIIITRVLIQEEKKDTPIPFKTVSKEDDKLSWRKKITEEKGVPGVKETTYRVSYHNGKEVNRHVLSVITTKEPIDEIVTQGTYVKVGKAHSGAASWYAFTGTLSAANPWLPIGSYVRVTNKANGKSVIVRINDRGPFVPGRIIDLDKVAFQKIASIGAGVIDVKMEEITN